MQVGHKELNEPFFQRHLKAIFNLDRFDSNTKVSVELLRKLRKFGEERKKDLRLKFLNATRVEKLIIMK